ncbi:alpha/beta hydrolase [Blastopirellula marina]|uniref:Lipase n=1 Tax=Blastopirellula marina TaxID=124 RepID=A0A2S8G1X5_9BACT|nr:alpha/beta hydrolase [Blastopirellula marina]PQO38447.1 lipase [Blastopirellula marina]PTL45104.1 alpha/beta hydrolase [Blastopirellula marina]
MKRIFIPMLLLLTLQQVNAAELQPQKDVPYGTHPRQVLDFYPAESDKPTPVVFYIHGGGWQGGDKKTNPKPFLDKGISVVAINYRYVKNAVADGITPPVKAPLEDAARALQFVRSKAGEWNLDKEKIGATGGSAGACSSLWLAFHDDMAKPDSDDPIARESTRLYCAAVNGAQVTLDPMPLREWMPNYRYGAHAFNLPNLEAVIEKREEILPWIEEYSPMTHVTKDDPPIFMYYGGEVPVVGSSPKDPTHSAIMGVKLAEKLKETGVEVDLTHPGVKEPKYKSSTEYLIDHLTK